MKIGTKGRLATTTALGTIVLLAATIWWAFTEVEDAERQRRRTADIARVLNDLRLVTFEYILYRSERADLQEREVTRRLDQLLATHPFSGSEPNDILSDLRERIAETQQIFGELRAAPPDGASSAAGAGAGTQRRFE